ncbi:MAG: ATP-binding cassette domain-containing protein [Blautia sp.]|nr:ATP-binding cassette domain-containing protein [Blautia sp.]
MKNKKQPPAIWAVCFWILLWQVVAMAVDQPIFFASPLEVLRSLFLLLRGKRFYVAVLGSFSHVALGILLATVTSVILGALSGRFSLLEELLSPFMGAVKSVPVVSYVILALICFSSRHISILITFLVVLPVLYANLLTGIKEVDVQLLEMAKNYRMRKRDVLRYLLIPELYPIFSTAFRLSCGMAWKAGVAAEVIGASQRSIGERIGQTKLYLETPELFAWTIGVLCCSALTEKLGSGLLSFLYRWSQRYHKGRHQRKERRVDLDRKPETLRVEHLSQSFEEREVLKDYSATYRAGEPVALMAPSGAGKTTLFRILAGFLPPDEGRVEGGDPDLVRLCFQEDRLLPGLDAFGNLAVANPRAEEEKIHLLLSEAGLLEVSGVPAQKLSGGQRRRVALLRALLSEGSILLLDEPFTGLDEERKESLLAMTLRESRGRILIVATHSPEEAKALGARIDDFSEG